MLPHVLEVLEGRSLEQGPALGHLKLRRLTIPKLDRQDASGDVDSCLELHKHIHPQDDFVLMPLQHSKLNFELPAGETLLSNGQQRHISGYTHSG